MGLFANDEPEQAVFFSPAKIAVVQVRQEEFEAQKEQKRLEKGIENQIKLRKKGIKG